jgi:hypothetical protein
MHGEIRIKIITIIYTVEVDIKIYLKINKRRVNLMTRNRCIII